MNPYDLAHQLAKALSCSQQYRSFKEAKAMLEKDLEAKEMFGDLREKQLEVETSRLAGKEDKEEIKALENLYNLASHNSLIRDYLQAEHAFGQLMMDIQKILVEGVNLD